MNRLRIVTRRTGVDVRAGGSWAFGTFGELLQGVLPDGVDFLVTFPIERRSHARFRLEPDGPLRVFPSHKWKALRLARMLLDSSGSAAGGTLIIDSDLPVGKGLASSSADLVATARVLGQVLGLDTSPSMIERWLRDIEPTDGVMYPGVVAFEHRQVRMRAFLGVLPPVTVVAVDEGGQVDTVAFNHRPKPFSIRDKLEYARLLDRLAGAVRAGDLGAVGEVTTRSAILNQRLQPKRRLDALLRICREAGGLGVVCAHSGTMIGVMLDDRDPAYPHRLAQVRTACAGLVAQPSPDTVSVFHSFSFCESGLRHAV